MRSSAQCRLIPAIAVARARTSTPLRGVRGSGPSGRQAGFSLVDVMVASTIMLIVVLGHVASTVAQHDLSREEAARSAALRAAGRFLERMRSDEDWAGLYARLRLHQSLVATRGEARALLTDGRRTYPLTTYIPAFSGASGLTVLVDVPFAPDAVTGQNVLREDRAHAELLLPSDLDGDGAIDATAHDADYLFLPIKATFRWEVPGKAGSEQLAVVTWLRGDR